MNKMANNTTTITLLTLIVLGAVGAGFELTDKTYFCEDRQLVYECNSLSKYYGLDNGKCINQDLGNKVCRSGWLKVEPETIDIVDEDIDLEPSDGNFKCDPSGCWEI